MTNRFVGQGVKRKEDPRLVSGTSTYVDDIVLPGMLYMTVVRSIHAHARIKNIDVTRARGIAGVHTVLTGEDTAGLGSVPCAGQLPDLKIPAHPPLARGKVRFVGEPVAIVVADDRYVGADAAEEVDIEYEPLEAVVDPEKAIQAGATVLHEEWDDNIAFRWGFENGNTGEALETPNPSRSTGSSTSVWPRYR